ncbi:MAG: hypothetical protein ACYTHM_10010 [Planctomycetota bacterium]|jgi:hypothetical protein
MPLSDRDRVERQVLRYLLFHERSPVLLVADREASKGFDAPDPAFLVETLSSMYTRNLFRILPSPAPPGGDPKEPREKGGARPPGWFKATFQSGTSVMITSEGKRRFAELRHHTRKIRQADWQETQGSRERGSWVRPDPDESGNAQFQGPDA